MPGFLIMFQVGLSSNGLTAVNGGPQVSVLGPLLFSPHINNLGVNADRTHCYTDDTVLYSRAPLLRDTL